MVPKFFKNFVALPGITFKKNCNNQGQIAKQFFKYGKHNFAISKDIRKSKLTFIVSFSEPNFEIHIW